MTATYPCGHRSLVEERIALVIWDESVIEKPKFIALEGLGPVGWRNCSTFDATGPESGTAMWRCRSFVSDLR